jgi:hypothetical protein
MFSIFIKKVNSIYLLVAILAILYLLFLIIAHELVSGTNIRIYNEQANRYGNAISKKFSESIKFTDYLKEALNCHKFNNLASYDKFLYSMYNNSKEDFSSLTYYNFETDSQYSIYYDKFDKKIKEIKIKDTNRKRRIHTKEILEPYFYSYDGADSLWITTFINPIFNENEDYVGYLSVDINLKLLQKLIDQIALNYNNYTFVTSNNGVIVAHSMESIVARHVTEFIENKRNNEKV